MRRMNYVSLVGVIIKFPKKMVQNIKTIESRTEKKLSVFSVATTNVRSWAWVCLWRLLLCENLYLCFLVWALLNLLLYTWVFIAVYRIVCFSSKSFYFWNNSSSGGNSKKWLAVLIHGVIKYNICILAYSYCE